MMARCVNCDYHVHVNGRDYCTVEYQGHKQELHDIFDYHECGMYKEEEEDY
jgi:hypothetical protein